MKNKKVNIRVMIAMLWVLGQSGVVFAHPMRPIPWITHEAVCFLDQFTAAHPDAKILEFGMGSSTLWFAKRTKSLVSVEHNTQWFDDIGNMLRDDPSCNPVDLIFHKQPYYGICEQFDNETFDLVLVDGRNRRGCIKNSIRTLKRGGILMLDNAERPYYQKALALLKNWKAVKTVQRKPDTCGFTYPNWQTHWYVKP